MNNITIALQEKIKSVFNELNVLYDLSLHIAYAYANTTAQADITAIVENTDPVSRAYRYTKADFINGITLAAQVKNFFENAAVSQNEYYRNVASLQHGGADILTEILSPAVEGVAGFIYDFAKRCQNFIDVASDILDAHSNNYIDVAITNNVNFPDEANVYGSYMNKTDLSSAITLITELNDLFAGNAVTTANYKSTLARWERFN